MLPTKTRTNQHKQQQKQKASNDLLNNIAAFNFKPPPQKTS
jgi:hypothetical protein